jgi:hypothetical protein
LYTVYWQDYLYAMHYAFDDYSSSAAVFRGFLV